MKTIDIIEARVNPEQNPKVPLTKIIVNAAMQTTDEIAGVKNLFVSFTEKDKLGIYPGSEFNTPYGIYSYGIDYLADHVKSGKRLIDLPYAGNEPYANMFSVSGNIINVNTITENEVESYYSKIAKMWIDLKSGESEETIRKRLSTIIEE